MKRKVTIEISDAELRDIIAAYVREQFDEDIDYDKISFLASPGYNGEMGGPVEPTRVRVFYQEEVEHI